MFTRKQLWRKCIRSNGRKKFHDPYLEDDHEYNDLSIPLCIKKEEPSKNKKLLRFSGEKVEYFERQIYIEDSWYNETDYLRFHYDYLMDQKYKTYP